MSRSVEELQPGWVVELRTTGKRSPGRRTDAVDGRLLGFYDSPTKGRCLELSEAVTGARWLVPVAEVTGAKRVLGRLDDRRRAKERAT